MEELFPAFNAEEAFVSAPLTPDQCLQLADSLRAIVNAARRTWRAAQAGTTRGREPHPPALGPPPAPVGRAADGRIRPWRARLRAAPSPTGNPSARRASPWRETQPQPQLERLVPNILPEPLDASMASPIYLGPNESEVRNMTREPEAAVIAGVTVDTRHWIGGERVASTETFTNVSPIDGSVLASIARGTAMEAAAAMAAAKAAFPGWAATPAPSAPGSCMRSPTVWRSGLRSWRSSRRATTVPCCVRTAGA